MVGKPLPAARGLELVSGLISTAMGNSSGLFSVGAGSAPSQRPDSQAPARTQLLVQWDPATTAEQRDAALARIGGSRAEEIRTAAMRLFGKGTLEVIDLPPGMSLEQGMRLYANRPGVQVAEPNWQLGVEAFSNDTAYVNGNLGLWGVYSSDSPSVVGPSGTTNGFGSQAEQAWAQGYTGSTNIVTGVIDTGIDYTHPDLYLNIWLNQAEIPTLIRDNLADTDGDGIFTFRDLNHQSNSAYVSDLNSNGRIDAGDLLSDSRWEDGSDNDGNRYVDDLIGWDFANNDNDPYDDNNHGTHVGGTIGAIGGNGLGSVGMSWNTLLVPLKFLSGTGSGSTSGAIQAIDYFTAATHANASSRSVFVGTNNSWGGGGLSTSLSDAIVRGGSVGNLFVAAAGNSASNNDITANYPSNTSTESELEWEAVLAVASIDRFGALSSFSNFGSVNVDLGAPGSSIYSTVRGGGYATFSGTSMATPHVTGALALMASQFPQATPQQLRSALLQGSVATTSLSGRTVTGGRLDVSRSLEVLRTNLGTTPPPPTYSLTAATSSVNEGASITFNLVTTDVAGGTTLTWKLSGTGITSADLVGNQLQGSVTVGADGAGSFTVTLGADQLTEGAETLVASLFADASPTAVLSSASVVVNDTSLTPVAATPLLIWGTTGSDNLTGSRGGGASADRITGVTATGTAASNLGRGQIDTVTGGAGADVFLLADARGGFYDDGRSTNSGTGDYLRINDFNTSDGDVLLMLSGRQYLFRTVTINGTLFSEVYLGNGDTTLNNRDELVARLEGAPLGTAGASSLGSSSTLFVVMPTTGWASFV